MLLYPWCMETLFVGKGKAFQRLPIVYIYYVQDQNLSILRIVQVATCTQFDIVQVTHFIG